MCIMILLVEMNAVIHNGHLNGVVNGVVCFIHY